MLFFAKAFLPILTLPVNTIVFNAVPVNAFAPIVVTDDGMVIVDNEEHPSNEFALILVNNGGNVIFTNEVHPEKVFSGIVVMAVAETKSILFTSVFASAPADNVVFTLAVTIVTAELNAPAEIAPLIVTDGAV